MRFSQIAWEVKIVDGEVEDIILLLYMDELGMWKNMHNIWLLYLWLFISYIPPVSSSTDMFDGLLCLSEQVETFASVGMVVIFGDFMICAWYGTLCEYIMLIRGDRL